MSWVFIWILVSLVTTMVLVAFALSLGRHMLIMGRTARRFREEVGSVASELAQDGAETSDRAQRVRLPSKAERS
jgi:Sec-independent protein translocase protein TatA